MKRNNPKTKTHEYYRTIEKVTVNKKIQDRLDFTTYKHKITKSYEKATIKEKENLFTIGFCPKKWLTGGVGAETVTLGFQFYQNKHRTTA